MANAVIPEALELAAHIAATYQLTSVQPLLQTCQMFAAESCSDYCYVRPV